MNDNLVEGLAALGAAVLAVGGLIILAGLLGMIFGAMP
jgi:hypothetical protein